MTGNNSNTIVFQVSRWQVFVVLCKKIPKRMKCVSHFGMKLLVWNKNSMIDILERIKL